MAAQRGKDFLVKIYDGASAFVTVAGMRSTSMKINNETVEINNKSNVGNWRELLGDAGIQSMEISLSGVFTDTASEKLIQDEAHAATLANYELVSGNGDKYTAPFQVTAYERAGDDGKEETFDITLASAGVVVFTRT